MSGVLPWLGVAALGALGALGRFALDRAVSARWPGPFPLGILVVNLTGGFGLGLLVGLDVHGDALLVLGGGLLGAYTTFSTWMLDSQLLFEERRPRLGWANLTVAMLSGLAATGLGWLLGAAA